MLHKQTGALELAEKMADADDHLSKAEALHWLADSEEAADMYVEEFVNEAKAQLAKTYPKFTKNFWWKGKSKRWTTEA